MLLFKNFYKLELSELISLDIFTLILLQLFLQI